MVDNVKKSVDVMQSLAQMCDLALNGAPSQAGDPPEKLNGFVLLTLPLDGEPGQRVNYISNIERDEIVVALKEVVARFEGQKLEVGHG